MTEPGRTVPELIAPCGINCRLCRAFARKKNHCPGCRADEALKPPTRVVCKIKTCAKLAKGEIEFCFECNQFPCAPVVHLDKRYRTRYATSVLDNLHCIRETGLENFIESENKKWACPGCGAMLCMHQPHCLACGHVWHT